jgi:hypothetical protein
MIMTFPTPSLDPRVGPAVQALVDRDLIAVLDMLFVTKDVDGTVATLEADQDSGLTSLTVVDGEVGALISAADIDYVGDGLLAGQSALVLVCEDRWARGLADVLADAGGVLAEGARIPTDVVEEAWADLEVVA